MEFSASTLLANRLRVIGVAGVSLTAVTASCYLFYRWQRRDRGRDRDQVLRRCRRIVEAQRRYQGLQLIVIGPREVQRTDRSMTCTYSNWFCRGAKLVQVTVGHTTVVSGKQTEHWWIITNQFYLLNAEAPPQLFATVCATTTMKYTCGQLTAVTAYLDTGSSTSTLLDGFLQTETCKTFRGVALRSEGGWFSTDRSVKSTALTPTAPPTGPEEAVPAEGREVPLMYGYFRARKIQDFTPRMLALRQAFTILMSDQQTVHYLIDTARMVLEGLVARTGGDPDVFLQAFDRLVVYSMDPAHDAATQIELAQSGIFHLNFLDVVFELCVFGVDQGQVPCVQVTGGFLDHLVETIHSLISTKDWQPEAEMYWQALRGELLGFLDTIFGFALQHYSSPEPLAFAVCDCLEQHIQQCLENLSSI